VTTHRCFGPIARAYFLASGSAPAAASPMPAQAFKQAHRISGMAGTDINVWPLSPQDWSSG
jgi:hypothetical protein